MGRLKSVGLTIAAIVLIGACGTAQIGGGPNPPGVDGGGPDGTPISADSGPPPPRPEVCNGFDDDLDGDVDEGCPCAPNDTMDCFPGQQQQLQGACAMGTMTCVGGGGEFSGEWGPCEGATLPTDEQCGDGIDQDCDGADVECPQTCESFTSGQDARPTDIVFAIDQSGSMGDDIANVRANMNLFAQTIANGSADYRVILVAARFGDPDDHEICIPEPLAGPGCADNAATGRFKQIDQHVDSHDAWARVMQHIGAIESAMRPNSKRHFVTITDDTSDTPLAAFDLFLKTRPGYQDYVHHSIVGFDDDGCSQDKGKNYLTLTGLTGGLSFDLCKAAWSALFTQLAQEVVTVAKSFVLGAKPKDGTLTVKINGQPSAQGSGWEYDPVVNQVVLKGNVAPGTQVEVCYQ